MSDSDRINEVCNLLALAALPSRLRVLRHLAIRAGELPALAEACGVEAHPLAGQLDLLRHAGLVAAIPAGDGLLFQITPTGIALVETIGVFQRRALI